MAATASKVARRAPYKDFLQPALHRRFTSTALVLLLVSYAIAIILAQWNSYLWAWFPIGPTGLRALFVFASGLPILVLRIAQYHVGLRTTSSGWQTISSSLTSLQTYETFFSYGLSGLWFGAVFLSAASETSGMRWITYFSGDRARLNERPLYFMCYLATCAILQTISHFQLDADRLDLGISKNQAQQGAGSLSNQLKAVAARLPSVLTDCIFRALFAIPVTHTLYLLALRPLLWGWTMSFFRPFYNISKSNIMPAFAGWSVALLARCVLAGTLLCFMWAAANTAFSTLMVKAPLKNAIPLTSESKDPNGSLLNGLKSKKLSIKCFALWELALIAQGFDVRRQAIFDDIDRHGGPMWSQVYATCMEVLKSIEKRVDEFGRPAVPPQPIDVPDEPKKRVTAPLREDPIYTSKGGERGGAARTWEQVARDTGITPAARLSPVMKKTWNEAKDRVLSKEQQEAISPDQLRGQFGKAVVDAMGVQSIGSLFRQEFRTEFAGAVLGTPHAEPMLYTFAATTLSELIVRSLAEDKFGQVHRDVASVVRTFTSVITKIETFKAQFPSHWTDATGRRDCPEVDGIVEALRTGLKQIVAKFEPYSADLRLSSTDMRLAKKAMIKPQPQEPQREEKKAVLSGSVKERERLPAKRPSFEHRRTKSRESRPEMEQVR